MKLTTIILGLALAGIVTTSAHATALASLNFANGITNTSSTVEEFSFTFPPTVPQPINLPAGTYDVSASFGITLTGVDDTATVSLPGDALAYMVSSINGVDAGVDIGTATETVTNDTEVFKFTPVTGQFTSGSALTSIDDVIKFDLSPGDSASFSGSFQISAVPEPSSVALSLIAVGAFAGLVVIRARRSRA
jgi:hypothetical protein